MIKLDHYNTIARLVPAFIALVPIAVVLLIAFPNSNGLWPVWTSLLFSAGSSVLLANATRDRGYVVQERLLKSLGEFPSTTIQRFSSLAVDKYTHIRRKARINQLLPELPVLSPQFESQMPSEAAEAYASVTEYLKSHTRDKKVYPLIYAENVSYGFRRNLLGVKPHACMVLLGCVLTVVLIEWRHHFIIRAPDTVGVAVLLALSFCWIFVVRLDWVANAGAAYAARLYEALESL